MLGMEFKTFVNAFMRLPCQIIRAGRRLIYRLLSWNPWQGFSSDARPVALLKSTPEAGVWMLRSAAALVAEPEQEVTMEKTSRGKQPGRGDSLCRDNARANPERFRVRLFEG